MIKNSVITIFLIGLLFVTMSCNFVATASEPTVEPVPLANSGVIVLGDVSDEPTKKIERFQPLADYLAVNLNAYGIGQGEVKIAPDLETMTQWMRTGEVDLYFDSSFPAMIVSDGSGAQPILRRWKGGDAEYYSIIFARTDSGLSSLEQLQGQIVAFEDARSTSGFMLPLAHLIEVGLTPVEAKGIEAVVNKDEIGYVFSDEDINTIQWVLSERVVAGAIDSGTLLELPEETRTGLIILAETKPVARQVVIARPDMPPDQLETIKTLLINLTDSDEGKTILEKNVTTRYDEFPEGAGAAFAHMRELYEFTQNQ